MSSHKNRWLAVFMTLFIVLSPLSKAFTQTVTGTISGIIVDASSAVIVGAKVTLIGEQTKSSRSITTGDSGRFTFAAIQPDIYTIKVEQEGFQTLERQKVVLSANESLALGELELKPGQVSETVTVTTEGAVVEKENSDLTARLTSDQIDLISTKGRDISSLLRLLPGVSYIDDVESVGDGFGTDLPNISGQRGRSTIATVDGLNASEPSGSNKVSMSTSQDAIAEVKVLRNNYAAEYGINGGAQITIVSKSGKKNYAGTGYYFLRNEALNANSFFNNRQALEKPLYRHNIWGFSGGGPVQIPGLFRNKERDKLFFFFSYEQPHTITPTGVVFVTVPSDLELGGDFSQSFTAFNAATGVATRAFVRDPLRTGNCNATDQSACFRDPSRATASNPLGLNIIPRSRLHPSGSAILNAFARPNQSGQTLAGSTFNFVTQRSADVPKRATLARVDFHATNKDHIYVKAQTWTSDNLGFGTSGWPGGDNNRWGIDSHYLYQDDGLVVNWVRVINPRIVNEFSVGVRHDSEGFIPGDGEIDRFTRANLKYTAPQIFPENNRLGLIPKATGWGGLSNTTVANINWLDRWGEVGNDYILPSISNNLTINKGNHNFKAGLYYERIRNGEAPGGGDWSGTFDFSSNVAEFTAAQGNTGHPYANALTGSFRRYTESSARPFTDLERVLLQWYGQDQWKVNRKLTLNYGVRMGWYSQWRQRQDNASNFDTTRFDPAKAVVLYRPHCVGGTPALGTACATANRRAINPVTGALSTNLNLVGTFVPGVGDKLNGIALGTDPTVPKGFKDAPPLAWEPRVGFAWDVFEGKTVLRAHFGVYHQTRHGGGTTGGSLVSNPPFRRNVQIDFGTIDNIINLIPTGLERPTAVNAIEIHAKTPTTYNFSIGIQQEIGFKSVLEVSYVGSLSRHLGERRNINDIPDAARFVDLHPENRNPFSNSTTAAALADDFLRPYQGYGDINTVMYSGSANYNGLQLQLNRRYTSGFQFGVAYTFSKSLDYANDDSSDVASPRPYRAFNYAPSDFDQTHIFTANYIWDVPGLGRVWDNALVRGIFDGWQLSGTTSLVTGRPKNVTFSYSGGLTDYTGGSVNARPNVVCDPTSKFNILANGARDRLDGTPVLVAASCFKRPTTRGEIGNLGRNSIRLPGVITTDLAFFKNFNLGAEGKRKVVFRWETYNLLNHTNFRDIDAGLAFDASGNQTNRRFGQPTAVRSGRVMQGSLRINF